jgi:diazepam-binding inhibitor (GABA receptor modulating acyl-CoA-binding protein)
MRFLPTSSLEKNEKEIFNFATLSNSFFNYCFVLFCFFLDFTNVQKKKHFFFLVSEMSNSAAFVEAAEKVKRLASKPSDQDMLELYGLYKQATVGDVNTERPGTFSMDFAGKAKWDAWSGRKGLARADAEAQYIATVQRLVDTHGLN